MSTFLSDEWLAELTDAASTVRYEGPVVSVAITVTATPAGGKQTFTVLLQPEAGLRYQPGLEVLEPASTYDLTYELLAAQVRGEFEPVVAFMQGNLKVNGATRPLFELFRLWATPEHRNMLGAMAETTEW